MLSLTEYAWEFLNDAFWDTFQHAKIVIVIIISFNSTLDSSRVGLSTLVVLQMMLYWDRSLLSSLSAPAILVVQRRVENPIKLSL